MKQEDIIRMAREAEFDSHGHIIANQLAHLERFAALVAAAEREAMMQLFTDPENQPTQHGTVTVEYMQREIAAEREACAKVCEETDAQDWMDCAAAIRAKGQA